MKFWWVYNLWSHEVSDTTERCTLVHTLEMKAAAIWEEMRYFASNSGSHLAEGWNHLWHFKKC